MNSWSKGGGDAGASLPGGMSGKAAREGSITAGSKAELDALAIAEDVPEVAVMAPRGCESSGSKSASTFLILGGTGFWSPELAEFLPSVCPSLAMAN